MQCKACNKMIDRLDNELKILWMKERAIVKCAKTLSVPFHPSIKDQVVKETHQKMEMLDGATFCVDCGEIL